MIDFLFSSKAVTLYALVLAFYYYLVEDEIEKAKFWILVAILNNTM